MDVIRTISVATFILRARSSVAAVSAAIHATKRNGYVATHNWAFTRRPPDGSALV